jgi:hypothetical protein
MSKCKECKCDVCKIVCGGKGGIHNKEYILDMKNGWTLNHCDASNWYLGYLVMSTTCHKKNFYELTDKELNSLGQNIKWINCHLNSWWEKNIPNDKIEQIYLAYLNESAYKRQLSGEELDEQLHVHIHMLPRTKSMREICGVQILGWDLLKIRNCFPVHYICDFGKREELMKYLIDKYQEHV